MTKILGIMGSPRQQGNTHILMEHFLEGGRNIGAQTELICLRDLDIQPCDGCFGCWKMGAECKKTDDMRGLYPKINAADVIVFGTPVYWYGPTALMKGFIDRWVYYNCEHNRCKIRNKIAAIIIPFEETDAATVQPVQEFFGRCCKYLEIDLRKILLAPGLSKKGAVLKKPEILQLATKMGRNIAAVAGGGHFAADSVCEGRVN